MPDLSPADPNSYARPDHAAVQELHLDWQVDFTRKVVIGSVLLTVKCVEDAQELILDTRDLVIKGVKDVATGEAVTYTLGEAHPNFGAPLTITLPPTPRENIWKVEVEYETSPSCSALQWLSPEQTAGKRHPYVFSQCQAIHCRSLLPCQDTPAVKVKYSAKVRAPRSLTVLMSALREGQKEKEDCSTHTTFKFRQPVPIPSYLIALAVGDLESRKVGPRSLVWSEKEFVDQSAYEFAETEAMLKAAEDVCGPYVWGQYDLLILPPSFPYGGMENPCLTFVTPTLLAGDRSLADVVIHEISHSWTGNLVTNSQWEHFWLNEGFTMFVQRKIEGRLKGGEPARHFSALGGWKDLADTIHTRGANDPLTRLVPDLHGVDPDDAFSTVPYEKGHTLLWYLEDLLGGPAKFEPFLKSYLEKFKFRSLVSGQFVDYLKEYFKDQEEVLAKVDWQAWWTTPGMPIVKPKFDESLAVPCAELARRWVEWDPVSTPCPFNKSDLDALSPSQVRVWLAELLEEEKAPLSPEKVCMMEEVYGMTKRLNAEIRFRWLRLGLKARWEESVGPALDFVTEQGRMKFVRPIYRDLYEWEAMRERAIAIFQRNRPAMMHVAAYVVAKDLHLRDDS